MWYQGTVTKIGPKRNLCKVRRVAVRTYLRESGGKEGRERETEEEGGGGRKGMADMERDNSIALSNFMTKQCFT